MAFETKLSQRLTQTQNLLMTPELQQAIKLLQLGRMEFIETIEEELLSNPLLEKEQFEESEELGKNDSDFDALKELKENSVSDWDSYLNQFNESKNAHLSDNDNYFENTVSLPKSLEEDLIDQLNELSISNKDKEIVLYLIGNLDRRGFLDIEPDEVAKIFECSIASVEEAHQILISMDPIGVGARNLEECLLIQLDKLGRRDSIEWQIINDNFDLLKEAKYDKLAKIFKINIAQVRESVSRINKLNPYPARQYVNEVTKFITPDVYIIPVGNDFQIVLNEEDLPHLKINSYYTSLLKSERNNSSRDYLNNMLRSANWLIRSIEQRNRTILKVTESIVKFQQDFLRKGTEYLKPLVLKEVADDIEMHESTVSRITNNKFVHTPQGLFQLKYFFASGIKTAYGELSSSAIKEKIRQIILAEAKDEVISDQQIVEILAKERIEIARRTVAKYRETLGIPSSGKRKRLI
jgi:RNA polymerase sigma-54 factor